MAFAAAFFSTVGPPPLPPALQQKGEVTWRCGFFLPCTSTFEVHCPVGQDLIKACHFLGVKVKVPSLECDIAI